jgi:hypothetical protein
MVQVGHGDIFSEGEAEFAPTQLWNQTCGGALRCVS